MSYFDAVYEPGNSLHEWSLVKYLSVLSIIDFEIIGEIRVGIDLKMDVLYKEALTHVLILSLKNLNGLLIEAYDKKHSYDLLITNMMNPPTYRSVKEIYILSELGSTFDINQIRKKIRNYRGSRRNWDENDEREK
ncbi:hypothetical protein GQR36_23335 [Enterococcus termitis]